MESISSLKKKYASLNKEWHNLLGAVHSDPKVVETLKAYEYAKEVYRDSIKGRLDAIYEEQKAIDKKVDELENKEFQAIPPEVNTFIGKLCAGVERGAYTVKWVSPSKRFIIVTEAGHMYWSGIGSHITGFYNDAIHCVLGRIMKDSKGHMNPAVVDSLIKMEREVWEGTDMLLPC